MWLTGRLAPDFKTIADFRRDNGPAIRATCRQFIALCRQLDLFAEAIVAIDGSRFKAVNTRDKNFTRASIKRRMEQVEASIDRYLSALATADRHDSEIAQQKSVRLKAGVPARADASVQGAGGGGPRGARSADLAHRSRCPRHGHQRQGHGDGRL
jgi:hypothetical protein